MDNFQKTIPVVMNTVQWLQNLAPATTLNLVSDSRKVQVGDVFFAYPVGNADGRNYIQQAIAQGACAVVYEELNFTWDAKWNLPHFAVANLLWQSGFIASSYLNQPDATLFTVAVTGTNGKTSCTQWLARAMSLLGTPTCVVGTLGVGLVKNGRAGEFDVTGFTTPDAIQLQQKIATQRDLGAAAIAIEASSIGLEQGRMNGMHVDVAVLTNFTRDHLDFHGDMASYEAAKTKLFEWSNLTAAVLNFDDAAGLRLLQLCKTRGTQVLGYTVESTVDAAIDFGEQVSVLRASNLRNYHGGTSFHLDSPFGSGVIKTQMIGRFNVSNVLAVLATLFAKGIAWRDAVHAIEQLTSVAGRMEQLSAPGRVLVIIDYAHTPDALEKTLLNLKEVAQQRQGKLWCVFGCGGDRDPGKRPEMGKIAELADEIIATSDNPRNEEPEHILSQIAAGFTANRTPVPMMEPDRAKAILYAIKHADKNDVVLLAGKGHEAYQEIKGKKLPFSDIDHAHIALADLATKFVNKGGAV
ncbi:UDP-N-acetylmuramoyl-L-alanyl-D-glutamate--2,6-diaminopimelate ligase [Solimicrobium silvestre]|uniref:UDP-N-acetylmuramoyl-L-alanyl-D-glutamate--2,6-diaminopimelate ligase n=1 Tax=Solimicrobium silvestre TaxID=2099400 RepID=A0A2S9H5E5_9BURK|nr:UDP-N-acetylmuramoyl-L-alanyl-D-glutamate--2,6-diaminopimelate ligase [Solimicrobium silvestre]PRC95209.1 murE: UDP-N-acetylmuramyl-tripeptide synthetase [Solimicrobium silvestre]